MRKTQTHTSSLGVKAVALLVALALALMVFPGATFAAEEPIPEDSAPAETQQDNSPPSDTPKSSAADTSDTVVLTVDGLPCMADEVLVQFKSSASEADVAQVLEETNLQPTEELNGNLHVAELPLGESVTDCIEALEQQSDVLYAQPNYVYYLSDYETAPAENLEENRSSLSTTNDTYLGYQWHLPKIGAFTAWDTTMGSSSIRVAVLDTGADLDHPDLVGRIVKQTDVADNDGSAEDDDGHGTHVAGIIAATANNSQGVAGVAPGVSLIIVDVFKLQYDAQTNKYKNYATTASIAQGITYAINNNADVINMSLGGYSTDSVERNAVTQAANAGIVVVAAAGNDATSTATYPGDLDSVICVTATDRNDVITSYSNFGSAKDISAPGGDGGIPSDWILSTDIDGDYAWMAGTSMATPIVSGVAALILSADPSLSVNDIKNKLYSSATDLGTPGKDIYYGNGRVNAMSAVRSVRGITASSFTINRRRSCLANVPAGTPLSTIQSALSSPFGTISYYKANTTAASGGTVSTGMYAQLVDGVVVKDTLFIAVKGDIDGDGSVNIADYTLLKLYVLRMIGLTDAEWVAGEVNGDSTVNIADYTKIKSALLKELTL